MRAFSVLKMQFNMNALRVQFGVCSCSNVIRLIYIHLTKCSGDAQAPYQNECYVLNWIYISYRFHWVHV